MTRESNSALPSSSTSVGILPIGFCCRTVSDGLVVSAGSILMSCSSPSTLAAIRILRTKGENGEERRINMGSVVTSSRYRRGAGAATTARKSGTLESSPARNSACDDEVYGLRALALLVGLDIEGDALSFGQ